MICRIRDGLRHRRSRMLHSLQECPRIIIADVQGAAVGAAVWCVRTRLET